MKLTTFLGYTLLSSVPFTAYSTSFDCSKASIPSEKAICKSSVLSLLDDELSNIYKQVKIKSTNTDLLKHDQIQFIKKLRTCLDNIDCLEENYNARISQLKNNIQPLQSNENPLQTNQNTTNITQEIQATENSESVKTREKTLADREQAFTGERLQRQTDYKAQNERQNSLDKEQENAREQKQIERDNLLAEREQQINNNQIQRDSEWTSQKEQARAEIEKANALEQEKNNAMKVAQEKLMRDQAEARNIAEERLKQERINEKTNQNTQTSQNSNFMSQIPQSSENISFDSLKNSFSTINVFLLITNVLLGWYFIRLNKIK